MRGYIRDTYLGVFFIPEEMVLDFDNEYYLFSVQQYANNEGEISDERYTICLKKFLESWGNYFVGGNLSSILFARLN